MGIKVYQKPLVCPKCGAPELNPNTTGPNGEFVADKTTFVIRAFKVSDNQGHWSECLRCAGVLDNEYNEVPGIEWSKRSPNGWFCTPL